MMSRFKHKFHGETIDGKFYLIDAHLVEALRHVPRKLLPPLLDVLDRDMRARHKAWRMADERVSAWKVKWVDEAFSLHSKGHSYASVGRIMEQKGFGSADRIARTMAGMVKRGRENPIFGERKKTL